MTAVLLDTGPLVAYVVSAEAHHRWACERFAALQAPVFICEAVITEAAYLLERQGATCDLIWAMLRTGAMRLTFDLETEFESVAALMRRYADVPMDLADACLVRMSELHRDCRVLTTDSDFRFYRRFGRQVVPLICPA